MHIPGHHDLYLYRPAFCFVLEPEDESGAHSNGQENGQVRLPYGKYPSRIRNLYPPLSRPNSIGGSAPSWKRCPAYYHDPPVDQSTPTGGCCETLASSQSREIGWGHSCLIDYPTPSIYNRFRGSRSVLYKSIIFPNRSHERGGLIEHTSQFISLIVSHLDINISRSGWGSSDRWCLNLFGYHGFQVNIDRLVFKNAETALSGNSRLVCACWTKNTY